MSELEATNFLGVLTSTEGIATVTMHLTASLTPQQARRLAAQLIKQADRAEERLKRNGRKTR